MFRGTILRNLNICVHLCHLWEDYLGLPHPPRGCSCLSCTNRAATASSHRIHRTHRSLLLKCTSTEFTEFSCRGEFLCILRVPWDNTTQPKHLCASVSSVGGLLSGWRGQYISAWLVQQRLLHPLTFRAFRPSSTSEINDYGYAPEWRLQPKPIVLARRPLLRHGRPA